MHERVPDSEDLRQLLQARRTAVIALASGGCARYIFSTEVPIRVDADGALRLVYDSGNPSHHDIVSNSGMDLRLLIESHADGMELSHLILTGKLVAEDALAAAHPAHQRSYRFAAREAYVEFTSGRRVPVALRDLGLAS